MGVVRTVSVAFLRDKTQPEKSSREAFATINAHSLTVVYFLHNGCDLPRVAIAAAKADNAPSPEKGEKA